ATAGELGSPAGGGPGALDRCLLRDTIELSDREAPARLLAHATHEAPACGPRGPGRRPVTRADAAARGVDEVVERGALAGVEGIRDAVTVAVAGAAGVGRAGGGALGDARAAARRGGRGGRLPEQRGAGRARGGGDRRAGAGRRGRGCGA